MMHDEGTAGAGVSITAGPRARVAMEADRLAAELGCEVTPFPPVPGAVEARNPAVGLFVVIGEPGEVLAACLEAQHRVTGTLRTG